MRLRARGEETPPSALSRPSEVTFVHRNNNLSVDDIYHPRAGLVQLILVDDNYPPLARGPREAWGPNSAAGRNCATEQATVVNFASNLYLRASEPASVSHSLLVQVQAESLQ